MVEIKIDTTKASKEDIQRAINFLKNYLDEPMSNQAADLDVPVGAMNIFDQEEVSSDKPVQKEPDDTDLDIKPIFY